MTTLLNPATGKYLLNPAPEFLHQEVTGWLSDLSFCEIEFGFLAKLLDAAHLKTGQDQQPDELKKLENKLDALRTAEFERLRKFLVTHERELSLLDLDVFKSGKEKIEATHRKLHNDMQVLTVSLRQLKTEIFILVEAQLKLIKKLTKDFEEGRLAL